MQSLIRSRIHYCNVARVGFPQNTVVRFQGVISAAARLVMQCIVYSLLLTNVNPYARSALVAQQQRAHQIQILHYVYALHTYEQPCTKLSCQKIRLLCIAAADRSSNHQSLLTCSSFLILKHVSWHFRPLPHVFGVVPMRVFRILRPYRFQNSVRNKSVRYTYSRAFNLQCNNGY